MYSAILAFGNSKVGRGTLKCSLAYLLGSLATFVPLISNWLGKQDGKHIAATVTVYFHPARSAGSMHEATVLAFVAFLYAAFVSFSSMGVSIFFGRRDLLAVGHAIVLIIFCGGGFGLMAWTKQRLSNPLVNVACSLASLSIITVLTKEGSVQAAQFSETKVVQVLKMVFMGITATTLVNLLLSPISARKELADGLTTTTDYLGDMMVIITRSFLAESDAELKEDSYIQLTKSHRAAMTKLKKDLAESKWEHYFGGTEKQHHCEQRLVECLQRLAQNLGGLKSAAVIQFQLHNEATIKDSSPIDARPVPSRASSFFSSHSIIAEPETMSISHPVGSIDEALSGGATGATTAISPAHAASASGHQNIRSETAPAEMFTAFIVRLGPSLKSLAYTIKEILDELPFGPVDDRTQIVINANFHASLVQAIDLFKGARRDALGVLYKDKELYKSRSVERLADLEEIAASCGHFSFALIDFAEDIMNYLNILQDLKTASELSAFSKSWNWLKPWSSTPPLVSSSSSTLEAQVREPLVPQVGQPKRSETLSASPFPRTNRPQSFWAYMLWRVSGFLRRDDIRFASKVGIGAAIFALPSFLSDTRPIYQRFRGEWGLVSYLLVCSMTIGAANTTGFERFLGTAMGAIFAVIVWTISDDNPWLLGFFGWIFSIGCFYIIVGKGKGPMGRFILLTYNLSALYAYSLSVKDMDDDDDEGGINPHITDIVFHRVVSVMAGCIWGIIITRVLWPISARAKLKNGLCTLWLRMSLIWKRDPLSTFLAGDPQSAYMDIREETELHAFLTHLDTLRKAAASEFELRGPFPDRLIGRVLETTARMLDSFHIMNTVMSKEPAASAGEAEVLAYTRRERAGLSARISHLFSVLASTVNMEYPINDVLPSIEHSRDRLLARIFEFRRNAAGDSVATDQDYELIYAYGKLL